MDILAAAKRHHMFERGDRVLVAVSGGPDSVALIHALHTRSEEFGISLHVAHLNHGIRGEASDLDELFVKELATELELPCTTKRVDVPALRKELRTSEEDAARTIRYNFLRETAANLDLPKIALGHNADDRAESVLLNVIRGAGIDGLGSIRPIRDNIVRPLLDTPRSEIEHYIQNNRLPFRVDESNMDIAYSRNRIRHELLPILESNYNPEIRAALVRLANIASETSDFLGVHAEATRREIAEDDRLETDMLANLHIALQRQIIRAEIEREKGDRKDLSLEQIDRIIDALHTGEDFTITLPTGRLYAVRKGNCFGVEQRDIGVGVEAFDIPLNVPGVTYIPHIGLTLESTLISQPEPERLSLSECLIDEAAINGDLRLRNWRPGDRIVTFGMSQPKKLQDVFVDKKISRRDRACAVLLVDDENVLWVVGIVRSEIGRVTTDTNTAVHIITTSTPG